MQYILKDNTIKIDDGNHYYIGTVNSEMFPEEIRDNYLEIIQQSFDDFTSNEYSVSKIFREDIDNRIYIINFHYKAKPFSFKRSIEIPMEYHEKDYKDYTNERIENMEETINSLNEQLNDLRSEFIQYKLSHAQANTIVDESEEEEEDIKPVKSKKTIQSKLSK
jgi:hypothetical protein